MKLKLNLKDKILKPRRWIEKIKENREVFIIMVIFMLLSFWSEPLRLDTLSLNTPCIPESFSLPITSRIPLEADNPKRNATSSYYTHLL